MDIFNDFDKWQVALRKIDLQESTMPYVRGKLLTENLDIYAKVQKLLNCKNMECCHPYLYNLDIEELEESEITKVNNLYKLGVDKGFIEAEKDDEDSEQTDECDVCRNDANTEPANLFSVATKAPVVLPARSTPMSAFTVMYSAMKDGLIKTGEAYSNSINTRSAKADVISKLERAGYSSISILAIEAGDPDMSGCDNTFCKLPEADAIPDYSVEEDDMIAGRSHNGHIAEADDKEDADKEADDKEDDNSEDADKDADKDNDTEDADSEDKEEDKDADSEDKEEDDKKEEKAEEPDEKLKDEPADKEDDDKEDDDKELEPAEKSSLKDSYKKAFKAAMLKCKYTDRSFEDLTLEEKVEFFTQLSKAWGSKADPSKFMTDKELNLLEKIVVKK